MDHLILPEGTEPWFKLAYDANEKTDWYENIPKIGLEYEDHYRRVGWKYEEAWFTPKPDEDTLGGELEDQNPDRKPWEIERFYQTWLIFGLIIEVFGLSGIKVTTEEFLLPVTRKAIQRPQTARLITTKRLPELIQEWRRRHQASRDGSIQHGILKVLNHVGRMLDHHCAGGKEYRSIHQYGKALWSISDATTTAIIAVASTLRKAACSIYNKPGLAEERWPVTNSKLLHQRILRKWCKSDAAMIMEDFDIDGQNYFAAATSRTLEDLDAHYACSDHSCEAKIADGTYTTLHDEECDNDDYDPVPNFTGHVHPDYGKNPVSFRQAIIDIMDAGHLPIMRWDSEQKGLNTYGYEMQSYVEDWSKARPFVAISHVWADGKGNPFDNSLPYCQLDKIQRLVDDLCANHLPPKVAHSSPGFWMDTLCCIVGPRDDEESQKYKSKSIASMREIYGESIAVLILDPWLMSTPSTAPVSEICYRIYASGWSRRLWTHQEGFLAREVYYQLQDKPLRLPEVDEMAKSFQDMMAHRGYPVTFPLQASGKTSFYYTTVKAIVHGIRDGRIPEDDKWMVYKHLAESLGYRSTTNIDDELLCVASVIGLNIKDYADLKVKGDPHRTAELRMQKFLRDIGRFRQGIIFNNYERLKIPGFRWAPVSLLGHRSSGLGDLKDPKDAKIEDYSHLNTDDIHFEVNTILGNSIKVNVNKYIPKMLNVTRKDLSEMTNPLAMYFGDKVVLLPTVGLPVDYPGHIINFSSKLHGLTINMAERRFGITFSPVSTTTAILKTPTLPKVPSFGKVPTISKPKFGGFGKPAASLTEKVEAPVQAATTVAETAVETITYKYVVFVADNDVDWAFDRDYVLILQKPLGDSKTREFLAMVGRKSVGPGKRYWVQSLCSAIVKLKSSNDDIKVDAGIDYVSVGQAATNWVVT